MRVIGFDVESFLIAPGVAAPKLVCGSFDDDDTEIGVEVAEDYLERFIGWIEDPDVLLVAHNLPFDLIVSLVDIIEEDPDLGLQMLRATFAAIKAGRLRCTKTRDKILENAQGELKYDWNEDTEQFVAASFTLARCMWNRCKVFVKKDDTWRKSYGLLHGLPISEYPPEAIEYSLKDSTLARQLFFAQEEVALAEGCNRLSNDLADLPGEIATTLSDFCLGLMRVWGVRTDPEITKIVKAEFQEKYNAAIEIARKWNLVGQKKVKGVVKPKRNMKAIKDRVLFIYTKNGAAVPMSDSGKNISTNRETLTFKRHPTWDKDEGLTAVADVVRYEKLLTTYVPILERGAWAPVTPDWNAMVETFRISCANPNLTNQPRGTRVRECFKPRDGWVYVSADYSTLELCTLAQVCLKLFGYSAMAESINQGRDLHLDMASEILGLDYAEVYRRYVAGDKTVEETRQFSKIVDFGAPGGMGALSFVDYARGYDVDVSLEQAKKLLDAFRRRWPEMIDYFNHCSAMCGDGGEAEVAIHPITGYVRGKIRYTALANHGFQHLAAVGAKTALCRVVEECYVDESSDLYGCHPVIFAHDEIIMEVPRDQMGPMRASAAADRLSSVMVEEMKVFCPDVLIKAESCMMRRWYKGAKGIRVDGILVPSRREGKLWVADEGVRYAA